MMKSNLAKNTLILGIGQLIPKFISLITLPILTTYLTVGEYGIYDLIISFSSLAIPLLTLLIQQGVFRFIINDNNYETKSKYITISFIVFLLLSLIWFFIVLIFSFCTNNYLLYLLIFILYFFESLYDIVGQVARGLGQNIQFSIAVILYSVINLILLIVLVTANLTNIIFVVIIVACSYFIASVYIFFKLKIYNYINVRSCDKKAIKDLLKYSCPIIPSSISLWVVNLSDRFLISLFLGTSMNGIYAAANKIPNLFGTVYNVFNLAWTEDASRTINNSDSSHKYSNLFDSMFNFLIGALILLLAFSPIMFNLLINEKFNSGYWQIPILFLGVFVNCLVSFYGGLYVALKNTSIVGISSFVGAVLNFILNILFIKTIGLYAASLSTLISFLIILIYRYYNLKKYIQINYNLKNILIGLLSLIVVIILFYINNIMCILCSIIISIIYNLKYNKLLNILLDKIKKK